MTPAISPANALIIAPGSAPHSATQGETFRDIFNESAPQISPMADLRTSDVAASFCGLAIAAPDVANPALDCEDKSEATSDEPMGHNNILTQLGEVAPALSVAQVIAAVAKAVTPKPETMTQTEDDASQPKGRAAAALTYGGAEQRQWFSKLSQNVAKDAPLAPKNQTPPAQIALDVPVLDIMPDIATAAVSISQPAHPLAAAPPDLRQLHVTPDSQWIETLRSEIVSSSARDNHLQFTLKPEHLGRLDIVLTTQDGTVDIRFDASTSAAIQILATQQAQLIDDLRQAGVNVGQFEMTNSQNGARQQQRHRHDAQTSDPQPPPNRNTRSNQKRGRFA